MARKYTRKVRRNKRHTRRRGGGVWNTVKGFITGVPAPKAGIVETFQRSPRSSNVPRVEASGINPMFKPSPRPPANAANAANAAIGIANGNKRPAPPSRESSRASMNMPGKISNNNSNFVEASRKLAELPPNSRRTSFASTLTASNSRRGSNAGINSRRGSNISVRSNASLKNIFKQGQQKYREEMGF